MLSECAECCVSPMAGLSRAARLSGVTVPLASCSSSHSCCCSSLFLLQPPHSLWHTLSPCDNQELTQTHPQQGGSFDFFIFYFLFLSLLSCGLFWGWEPEASPGNDSSTASLGLSCGLNIDLWCDVMWNTFSPWSRAEKHWGKSWSSYSDYYVKLFWVLRQIIPIFGDKFKACWALEIGY